MERDRATTFVAGAAGFVGRELVKVLTSGGHHVVALSPTIQDARDPRRIGAATILGNLREPGKWQDETAADWVFHLPDSPASTRMSMDAHLLDAVAAGTTRRIVYVADARWYGATGAGPITETSRRTRLGRIRQDSGDVSGRTRTTQLIDGEAFIAKSRAPSTT
jgi:nucleoside-diphosphate-sugar epimerase